MQCRADNGDQGVRQFEAVILDSALFVGREHNQVLQVGPHHGSGVGMAGIQEELGALEAKLLPHARGDFVGDGARNSDDIHGNDDYMPVSGTFERQRLGPQRHKDAARRVCPGGVPGHPDRAGGSDIDSRRPGFQMGAEQIGGTKQENNDGSHMGSLAVRPPGITRPSLYPGRGKRSDAS